MYHLRLTGPASRDIVDILDHSLDHFGDAARKRYETLIEAGLRDLAADPFRAGSKPRPEHGPRTRSYHLLHSRKKARITSGIVQAPRHLIFYHIIDGEIVEVIRLLHDAMEPRHHLP